MKKVLKLAVLAGAIAGVVKWFKGPSYVSSSRPAPYTPVTPSRPVATPPPVRDVAPEPAAVASDAAVDVGDVVGEVGAVVAEAAADALDSASDVAHDVGDAAADVAEELRD